ncbi:MAG: hypothetical protein GPJ20_19715 [Microcystis aeruginosa BS13-10]|jgi:hypothetical protein|uniref:Uncharacterized protein n=1 Tax=Microcystis aeruginosa G11-04 TaxID=2685956 RepID=A0A966G269_MICAE|nr:hypothetical protein [Microcystis aeruginosa BS13-10]NCS58856.1 hypothetical protein [Microcystis aeruginosa G11-04]NCT45185.1 hypothetical protein [Microcystis aeruginosa G11-09]
MLKKQSKIDGRFLVVAALLGYFGLLYLANFFVPYREFWRKLGVPAAENAFIDLAAVLGAFDCDRLTGEVSLANNSCFTQIFYPSSWSLLTWLGLEQRNTIFLGVFFALIFYVITLIIIGRLNYQEAIVYALILCSPPVMLLVERGNVDIVIYSWLGVALMIIKNSRALIFRLCAYLLIFFWGVIKLFPIFGLAVIIKEKRNLFLFLAAIFTTAFITYFLASIGEMKTISSFHYGLRIWYSFGYKVLFGAVKYILSRLTSGETDIKEKLKYMMYIIMILYTMSILTRVLLSKFKIFKEWLSSDFVSTDSDKSLDKSRYIDYFRLAAAIHLGNFLVIGMLFDYKLTFLIFALPQILDWIKQENQLSLPSSMALVAMVATFYASPFLYPWLVDEMINWLLAANLLYISLLSMPEWLKSLVHKRLSGKFSV